jgi:hypothetical protein
MASGLYAKARKAFLDGDMDWLVDVFKVVLIDVADYTVNLTTHDFLDDVAAGARVGTPVTLTCQSVGNGVADATDATLTAVTGDPCEAILIYKFVTNDADSIPVAYIDGITVTPNGGDITIQWDAGASRIFSL